MLPETEDGARWIAPDDASRPFHRLLHRAAQAGGARLEVEPVFRHLARVVRPDGTKEGIFGNALGLNTDAAAALAADKTYAAQVLRAAGFAVPEGCLVVSDRFAGALALKNARAAANLPDRDAALEFAGRVGFPVFVKPNRGAEGAGVSRAASADDLRTDLSALLQGETHVRVEQACPGLDLRVIVLEGCARIACLRHPAAVRGDGRRRLRALIADWLDDLARTRRGAKLRLEDPRLLRALAAAGLGLDSVPEAGRQVVLLANANLSTGGMVEDVADRLPSETAALACAAAGALGLRIAGVDLLVPDPALGPVGATVLEVNSAPGLDVYAASAPLAEDRALAFLRDALDALRR